MPNDSDQSWPTLAAQQAHQVPTISSPSTLSPKSDVYVLMEIMVVLSIGVFPTLFSSLSNFLISDIQINYPFKFTALYLIFRSAWVCLPLTFIIWRSQDSWSYFGLTRPSWIKEFLYGVGIWVAGSIACWFLWAVLFLLDKELFTASLSQVARIFRPPVSIFEQGLLVIACCANGFCEEMTMRGYLIPRFSSLLGNTWKSVILTAILFGCYHSYQGIGGILNATLLGVIYGFAFVRLKRIWPVAIAHAIADFAGWMW
jgi:membrane protease YdiL (CAAX protease family)